MATPEPIYKDKMYKTQSGLVYDMNPRTVLSKKVEGSNISQGLAVSRGTDTGKQVQVGGSGAIGIAVRDLVTGSPANEDGSVLQYSEGDVIPVMTKGFVWVRTVTTTVNVGDPVVYDLLTGAITFGAPGGGQETLRGAVAETSGGAGGSSPDDRLILIRLTGNEN